MSPRDEAGAARAKPPSRRGGQRNGAASLAAAARLREMIFAHEDGAYLGSQGEIMERLGVARVTLQQTARLLEQEQLLRVQRDETSFYYLEYRQPVGVFDNFKPGTPAVSGVIVVIGSELRGLGKSLLLDMSPETTTLADAPLALNKSYEDPAAGVKLTVVGLSPESARIDVKLTPPAAGGGR